VPSPLYVSKSFDRASVKLFQSASTGERFNNFRMDFTRQNQMGQNQLYYRIELEDGLLIELNQAGDSSSQPNETASLAFSRIILTDLMTGSVVIYDWNGGASTTPEPWAKGLLAPPSPNPSSELTKFSFALPVASDAELSLFDLRGRLVRELHRGWTTVDPVVEVWDLKDDSGAPVAQGLYLARLTYPGTVVTQRVMVVR
jgi:hypothetical protein